MNAERIEVKERSERNNRSDNNVEAIILALCNRLKFVELPSI